MSPVMEAVHCTVFYLLVTYGKSCIPFKRCAVSQVAFHLSKNCFQYGHTSYLQNAFRSEA